MGNAQHRKLSPAVLKYKQQIKLQSREVWRKLKAEAAPPETCDQLLVYLLDRDVHIGRMFGEMLKSVSRDTMRAVISKYDRKNLPYMLSYHVVYESCEMDIITYYQQKMGNSVVAAPDNLSACEMCGRGIVAWKQSIESCEVRDHISESWVTEWYMVNRCECSGCGKWIGQRVQIQSPPDEYNDSWSFRHQYNVIRGFT